MTMTQCDVSVVGYSGGKMKVLLFYAILCVLSTTSLFISHMIDLLIVPIYNSIILKVITQHVPFNVCTIHKMEISNVEFLRPFETNF